ncbi:uncharacterized protein LOC105696581 [Orussus abietinus]|uniref:uncharacterized protein LOC105696581 n=1 Tax=Orussus abietinus TaxID=222816 RepID=UPI0006256A98|nr:uncharacterized protein LOC105696581 [Orussus abietinus]
MKVDNQSVIVEPTSSDIGRSSSRRFYLVRTMYYYNFRLIYVILNCIALVAGVIFFGAAVALTIYKETILVVMKWRIYVSSLSSLYVVAFLLMTLSTAGLCFVHRGPRKMALHAGCTLLMAAVMISIPFLQTSAQAKVILDAESSMLSFIQPKVDPSTVDIWDHFHETFKCCGVHGYLDWCRKEQVASKNITSGENILDSYTCQLPETCCKESRIEPTAPNKFKYTICTESPTPWNTHRSGCLPSIKTEIYYFGKVYRIISFTTAVILLLQTIASTLLFTYM